MAERKAGAYSKAAANGAQPIAMLNSLDIEGRPADTRVVVAMSGGVDSSVTAALLADAGYDVVGITLQLYDHGAATHRKGACCAGRDIHDARAVAERIGIPHYVLDYESRFKEAVIDRFAESYVAGETPVPCVECNQSIKFRDLLETARELGAKVLATGHYVASRALPGGGRALYRAREAERDQSYFLFATTRAQLDLLRFPLGDRTKAETRELARRFGLSVADKHDSQDICFVPTGHYADVIERLRPGAAGPGDIVDLDGRVLGRHDGIIHFTVGQRRGLGIAGGAPLYVVRLDAGARRVVVGPREALRTSRIRLRDVNWLGDGTIEQALAPAVARSSSKCARRGRRSRRGCARGADGGIEVELVAGEDGVSPGQACVFYDAADGQARVLGGGFIASTVGADVPARAPADLAAVRWMARGARDGETRWRRNSTRTRSPRPMRAGRRSTISCSARCSIAAARLRSPRPSASAAASSKSASAPAFRCPIIPGPIASSASIFPRRCCARRKARVAEHRLTNVDGARGDGRAASRLSRTTSSTSSWRNTSSPRCPTRKRRSTNSSRVVKPGGEIILVNHLGAESGLARVVRAMVRAGGAPARLAAGIRLGAPGAWAARHGGVRVVERRAMPPLGHFSLIRFARLDGFARQPFCRGGGRA